MAKPNGISKQELIASAMRCIAENGIGKLSLKAVAEGAGVTQGTVYYHFKSKEQLLFQIVKEICETSWNELVNTEHSDLKQAVAQALHSARSRCDYESFYHQVLLSLVVTSFHHPTMREQLGTLFQKENDYLAQLLDRLGAEFLPPEVSPQTAGILFNALIDGLALQALLNRNFPADLVYSELESLLTKRIKKNEI
ncbi:TetR family transcriptional regulator [Laceyella sacchari]|uniref:Transcriptional regulator, TetR family n=2 Tax=Laceyella TaxID=292635 RepID=A0AA45WN83_9BACL|nr:MULTISPECIES: TetR/AcrR family transcriptional regulator [Laceyella]AUS09000.1 TetR family transcriptional regulator [Laceyella sacchari]PRZ15404.1 TetR family transcriptional regulator [Laceyella sediminis]SMP16925.1 transcriptional regulator, TetR family [Laceyella tengchongensis]